MNLNDNFLEDELGFIEDEDVFLISEGGGNRMFFKDTLRVRILWSYLAENSILALDLVKTLWRIS